MEISKTENITESLLSEYNSIIKENEDIYRDLARKMGRSECGFWILYMLRTGYGAPVQSELCTCLHEPKQTINSALKKMESEGYLELIPGKDHRSKQILLTQKGTRLCEETVDKVVRIEQDAFRGLAEKEQEQFLFLFHKFTDLLKKYMRKIP